MESSYDITLIEYKVVVVNAVRSSHSPSLEFEGLLGKNTRGKRDGSILDFTLLFNLCV